jgi:CheY-like chemotaxis protein
MRELTREARGELGRKRQTTFVPLLVEDDPDQALLMVKAFAQADIFSPLPIMKSGEELIAFLTEKMPYEHRGRLYSPSLILLDVHLPGQSGLEVLEWIRIHPRFHRIPVAMLSSSSNPDYINRAYTLGAKSYLIKPTSFSALVEMVSGLKRDWTSRPTPEL